MKNEEMIPIKKKDLIAAWTVLENLTVSFDQMGGSFGRPIGAPFNRKVHAACLKALDDYLKPRLVNSINDARMRLGSYIPDEEAEALADKIPYWDYAGLKKPALSK